MCAVTECLKNTTTLAATAGRLHFESCSAMQQSLGGLWQPVCSLAHPQAGRYCSYARTLRDSLNGTHSHSHTKRIPAAIRRNQCTALPQQIPKQAATTRKAAAPAPGPGRESGRGPPTGTRRSSKRQQQQLDFRRQHQSRTRCRCRC